jgi:putative hydrolase of the HAD superfamily
MNGPIVAVVVFDAVGTLIYPEPSVAVVYTAIGRRFGSKLTEEQVGGRFRRVLMQHEKANGDGARTSEQLEYERWRRIVGQVLTDVTDLDASFAELFSHFAQPESWRAFPDVPEALDELRAAGIRVGVASNFDKRLDRIIAATNQLGPLDFVLAATDVGYCKPHAAFFEAIVARAAVAPACVLYVGDDPVIDVSAASAAGLQGLLVDRKKNNNNPHVLQTLRDIVPALDRLGLWNSLGKSNWRAK